MCEVCEKSRIERIVTVVILLIICIFLVALIIRGDADFGKMVKEYRQQERLEALQKMEFYQAPIQEEKLDQKWDGHLVQEPSLEF